MMEGSGSVSMTNGSGSGRPKNIWIRNTGMVYLYSDLIRNQSAVCGSEAESRKVKLAHKIEDFNYLCTYDLYGPMRNAHDACIIHYEGKWEWVGHWKSGVFLQGFGFGSGLDPDSIGPVDPDPDPGGQK
jgi:hypothetical protein